MRLVMASLVPVRQDQGLVFGMGDGSVRLISTRIDSQVFRFLGNRHDGQVIGAF